MTPQQINTAIAEAVGYTDLYVIAPDRGSLTDRVWGKINGLNRQVPNYHGDLNAMHEAEGTIPVDERTTYFQRLYDVTYNPNDWSHGFAQITATAAQRAEAFLRTIGKWEDGE